MATCSSLCAPNIPPSAFGGCKLKTKQGGLSYALFKSCDVTADMLADGINTADNTIVDSVWRPFFEQCKLRISPLFAQGGKDQPAATSQRISVCLPEVATLYTHTYNFTQRVRSLSNQEFDFWNGILSNQFNMQVGFFSCTGDFTPFYPFTVTAGDVIAPDRTGLWEISGTISIETEPILIKPVQLFGLQELALEYASYDCTAGGYKSDTPYTTIDDLFGA